MEKILSEQDINRAKGKLEEFNHIIQKTTKAISTTVGAFENNEIVQSLFISGGFGEKQKNELIKIKNALEEYQNTICASGGLYSVTAEYLDAQLARTQSGQQ